MEINFRFSVNPLTITLANNRMLIKGVPLFPFTLLLFGQELLFQCVFAALRSADALHRAVGFNGTLLALRNSRRGSVSGVDFGRGLALPSGMWNLSWELKPAKLPLISTPICIPHLLAANNRARQS